MSSYESLKTDLENLKSDLENFDKSDHVDTDAYDESLDSEGDVLVCGMYFAPSRILKELDETAYRCGLQDWIDGMECSEFVEYASLVEQIEQIEEQIEEGNL